MEYLSNDIRNQALLKFRFFHSGIYIDNCCIQKLKEAGCRVPSIVRAGASYGIEALINDSIYVNIPINPHSALKLSSDLKHVLFNNKIFCKIEILKNPIDLPFYKNGKSINGVSKICFDRLGITVNTGCYLKEIKKGCGFCGIDRSNHYNHHVVMQPGEVLELVDKALLIPNNGIRHLLLSGGAFQPPDYGAKHFSLIAKTIKEKYPNQKIYVMLPPPVSNYYLDEMIHSGVDEIALNIELVSNWGRNIIPGKAEIGLERYVDALKYLSYKMPKYSVRSIIMAGVEDTKYTLNGVEIISSVGAMPIISYYRQVGDMRIKNIFKDEYEILDLFQSACETAGRNDMIIGPTCIPCQNNVIAIPYTKHHLFY